MKTQRKIKTIMIISIFMMLVPCSLMVNGQSWLLDGGSFVKKKKAPKEILVRWDAEGEIPDEATYMLVLNKKGEECVFEREADGGGTLFELHWKDDQGDHFAAWFLHAYEFIIPFDRTKPAEKYVYLVDTYTEKYIDGVKRPVPNDPDIEPVAKLIPQK
ncbi:MAG: hypothetical protein HQ542_14075 [Bacteroidia bacterium]|nr:hypothetical protein [Bacteroidia bacterium]